MSLNQPLTVPVPPDPNPTATSYFVQFERDVAEGPVDAARYTRSFNDEWSRRDAELQSNGFVYRPVSRRSAMAKQQAAEWIAASYLSGLRSRSRRRLSWEWFEEMTSVHRPAFVWAYALGRSHLAAKGHA